jgi:hypothetical protein
MAGEIAAVSCALGFSGERLCQCVDMYIFCFFLFIFSKSLSNIAPFLFVLYWYRIPNILVLQA